MAVLIVLRQQLYNSDDYNVNINVTSINNSHYDVCQTSKNIDTINNNNNRNHCSFSHNISQY